MMAAVRYVMTEQENAPEAPAPAVEASQGAQPGQSPTNTNNATHEASGSAPTGEASPSPSDEGGEGDESEGGDEAEAAGPGDAQPGDPAKKKRRRRRRKKGPGQPGAEGVQAKEGGGEAAGGERPEKPAKEGPGGVFARFFEGAGAGKRHAFSAGEVVAGRVSKFNDGTFTVDLFGKASAFVDLFEPHEIPVLPDPPAPVAAAEGEAAPAAETPAEGTTEAAVSEAGAEAPVAEAATSESSANESTEASAVEASAIEASSEAVQADGNSSEASADAAGAEDAGHEEAHEEAEPEPEPPPPPDLGSIFRGRVGSVSESGHIVIVNRIIDTQAAKQRLARAREQRKRVRGVVFGFNRGGFDVLVEGIRVFCPASGMSLGPVENPEELLGQRLEFTVPPSKAGTHGFVVSRRGILERQQRKAAKQLFRSLTPGQRLKGRVTQVREFGLFVDLGGIEGLVHQSELSFSRGVRPQDAAKPGDEVEVQVLRVGEGQTRRERERVSLSMKALQSDPWGSHADLLEPGNVVTGKVVRTTDFGAFIELTPQIEGLLHISELGRELKHANQVLQDGQEIRVVVERVDRKARRISLSRLSQSEEKALESGTDSKSGRPPKPGQHLTVVVDKVDAGGLIVQIPGVFGRRGRGFIPNAEMGTERGTDHRKGFPPGTQIPVKNIGVDRDGGYRFSRKALMVEEEKRAIQDYRREVSRQGLGTFGDLLRAKLEGGKQG
jgi:small subunit ribosomal protein S1